MAGSDPFTPVRLPSELAGLTAGMLSALYDVVLNFGVDVKGTAVRRLCAKPAPGKDPRISKEMYVSVVVPPALNRNIMISRWPGSISTALAQVFYLNDGRSSPVFWDKSFSVDDVVQFIAAVDDEMRPLGAIDPVTGSRSRMVCAAYAEWQLSVDAVFTRRGHVVESGDMDAEALKCLFDRPEDLTVFSDAAGRKLLCLARDMTYIETRSAVTREVLARRGIESLEEVAAMPAEERKQVLAAVEAAMRSVDN